MRILYTLLIRCAVPFAFCLVLWRGLGNRGYRDHLRERFGWGAQRGGAACIWVHAVSLGEMSAAAPLLRALGSRYPESPLVVTTATPTGRARAISLCGAGADVRFLPYDTPAAVRRFLRRIQPRLAIIMETELWPNLYRECEMRGVPVVLASARLSAKSVARYRRLSALCRDVFAAVSLIAAQTPGDAERFREIGAHGAKTRVVGNLKFDIQVDDAAIARGRELRAELGGARPVWVAGSTHEGEEAQVLDAHAKVLGHMPDALLLLVPRHPARFEGVADLLRNRALAFVRRSDGAPPESSTQLVLVDTVGELAALYAAADVAFVGGSLVPAGGHNLLEPAALGLPVVTGPSHANGEDVARLLFEAGAALQVADAAGLAAAVVALLRNPRERQRMGTIGRNTVEANRGSVLRLLDLMAPLSASAPRPGHP